MQGSSKHPSSSTMKTDIISMGNSFSPDGLLKTTVLFVEFNSG